METKSPTRKSLNIGFVSVWFERGQAYVTKTLRDTLADTHHPFVFARTGRVFGQRMVDTEGPWCVPDLTLFPEYEIPPKILIRWIRESDLEMVVFNEEYDWDLVQACKAEGVKVLTYLDYFEEGWRPRLPIYDVVLCSTRRTYDLVKDVCNARLIGWSVDTNLFKPSENGKERYTFFHNAGWLGINYRKMTPVTIAAFDVVSKRFPDCSLLVHAQAGLDRLPPGVVALLQKNPRITCHVGTVPAPGLYHKGQVLVFPSKLEGLGLPLLEGLSCGLPAVATDAPPMNEFIREGENGLLVPPSRSVTRADSIAFPEAIVDVKDLAFAMAQLAAHPERIAELSAGARRSALTEMGADPFRERLQQAISAASDN